MREFQEKRRVRKILYSPGVLAALLIMFILISVSTVKVYLKSRLAVSKNEKVEQKIEELRKRKSELEKEIKRLQSNFGAEEEIRKKFNVMKPGEKVIVIVDKSEKIDFNEKKPAGFWKGVWGTIKEIF